MEPFQYKQAILVRTDLKMGKGKIAIQVAHASVSAAERARVYHPLWWGRWLNEGQCKVALKVAGKEEIFTFKEHAERESLPTYLVEDRGLTQIPPGSITCLGIGPGPTEKIDRLTGQLPLL
ncbi:peptidyl-tRNA hydrolase Pth2 [[Eubacterium] cellulosolvens]